MSANRELLRLRYGQGQTVRSSDFREKHRVEGELRAWHNRAMHNAYGVATEVLGGLKVELSPNNLGVTVTSGLAFDCFGRELILRSPTAIDFPDFEEPSYLVLSYEQRVDQSQDATLCFNSCGEAPSTVTLSWILTKNFSVMDGVLLGETEFAGGRATLKPKFHPLNSRPLARPRIATGNTIPGATKWEQWDPHRDYFDGVLGYMQVKIDTSSAGFSRVPAYFAWLEGSTNDFKREIFTFHFDHLDEVTTTGFVFRVTLTFGISNINNLPDDLFFKERAYVSWLAIEPAEQ